MDCLTTDNQNRISLSVENKLTEIVPNSEKYDDNEINQCINEFQKHIWNKYGFTRPTNWIDPFESYESEETNEIQTKIHRTNG